MTVDFVDLLGAFGVEFLDVLDAGVHLSVGKGTPMIKVLISDWMLMMLLWYLSISVRD